MSRRRIVVVLGASLLWACASDAAGPTVGPGAPGTGSVSQTASDPAGDTFGNRGTPWDLTGLTVTRDTSAVTVVLEFSTVLVSPTSGDSNAMLGFVDFDTDQDPSTGASTIVDEFRRDSGSTGMAADYQVALTDYAADSSVSVFDESGTVTGRVKPVFSGNKVTIRIPRTLLGNDDGFLNAAAIVGTQASPTDIVPERGHLELSDEAVVAAR